MSLVIYLKNPDTNEIEFTITNKSLVNAINNLKKQNKSYIFDVSEIIDSKDFSNNKNFKSKEDVIKNLTSIIKRAKENGMTIRALRNYSRSFKKLGLQEQLEIINEMKETNIIREVKKPNSICFVCVTYII